MHKITKIERQKKSTHRYNLYIDGEFAFGIDEEILLKNNLHKGLELTKDDMIQLIDDESVRSAYLLAIRYLSYRIRTKREMEIYLREKAVEEILINETIERLIAEKLINDSQFAEVFVRDRINQTSKGPRVIENELREKGIPKHVAVQSLESFTYEQQLDKVLTMAEKELKKPSSQSYRHQLQKVQAKIMRRGYGKDVVNDMIQELDLSVNENDEIEALRKQAEKISRKLSRKYDGYELNQRLKSNLYGKGFSIDIINEYLNDLEQD